MRLHHLHLHPAQVCQHPAAPTGAGALPPATCTSSKIDMVLCLDGSYSMGSSYSDVQDFAELLMDKFTISADKTRVAVLRFESDVDDSTNGFSSSKSDIVAQIRVPLPGGITNTHKCIQAGKDLLTGATHTPDAAQLLLVLTDGSPSDQNQAELEAKAAIGEGVVIVGVGVNVGSYGVPNVLKMTSNQCADRPSAERQGCSAGLTGAPSCVTPCDDHYIDAGTFDALADNNILDSVVEAVCVDPGCQYSMGPWSECDAQTPPMRYQDPVISWQPTPPISAGLPGACPGRVTEACLDIECAAEADFLLLLDSSGSMTSCDWRAQGWFAREFVSKLPSDGSGKFKAAQVAVMQFSSDNNLDHALSDDRNSVLNTLDCDRCSDAGGTCSYAQQSGGTSTMQAMIGAISLFQKAPARPNARKVIILATDGTPNGAEALPSQIQSWCQGQGMRLSTREDIVVCASKYAQATPGGGAPNVPAKTCGLYDFMCQAHEALEPLEATVVTVGVNVGGYSGAAMDAHFTAIASDPSLYLKVENIKGPDMDDVIKDLLSKACPAVDCVCKPNTPWGQCDLTTGLQTNKCVPITLPDKGGRPCVSPTRPCGDCAWHWGPFGACNPSTGLKTRSVLVDKQPVPPDGVACPTDTQDEECGVPCEYTWGAWSTCKGKKAGAQKTRSPTITRQPLNGGKKCPDPETSDCGIVDCDGAWEQWTACAKSGANAGTQSRTFTITTHPEAGGIQCPDDEERTCKVDCVWTYPDWATECPLVDAPPGVVAGLKKRSPIISQEPKNGQDGEGTPCPGDEELPCPVPCAGNYGDWSICASPSGNYPPFTRSRAFVVTRQPLNGGTACPRSEQEPCLPEVCYYAENTQMTATEFGFNGRKQDMRPLRTLPPNHVALKPGTSTLLSGCTNVQSLTKDSIVPASNSSWDEKCTGADLFYALDGSMSLSGMDKDKTVQLFLLQNSGAQLFFGILNGKSAKSDGADATANIRIDLENIDSNNKGVEWQVTNDPVSASNVGKSAQDCYLADASSGGCYQWDPSVKIGQTQWRWDDTKTSGGILGPLPSYGFCAVLKRGDTQGIDGYEFADGGVGPDDAGGIPTYTSATEYKKAVPMVDKAFDTGSEWLFVVVFPLVSVIFVVVVVVVVVAWSLLTLFSFSSFSSFPRA
jgi:Mg-chelatase subunit ChlD